MTNSQSSLIKGSFRREMLRRDRFTPRNRSPSTVVEYYGTIGFLKAGLLLADRITNGFPNLRGRDPGTRGRPWGLMAFFARAGAKSAERHLLNGIDTSVWNPATDPNIASNFQFR